MKVWIDRDSCTSNLSACLSCFGQLLRTGAPDRACILDFEDDGSEDFTIFMHAEGENHEPLVVPKDMREMVAFEGWDKFVNFEPKFRKNEGSEQ